MRVLANYKVTSSPQDACRSITALPCGDRSRGGVGLARTLPRRRPRLFSAQNRTSWKGTAQLAQSREEGPRLLGLEELPPRDGLPTGLLAMPLSMRTSCAAAILAASPR